MSRWLALALVLGAARLSGAQRIDRLRAGVTEPQTPDSGPTLRPELSARDTPIRFAAAIRPYAPVVSAIIPGAGQLILGNERFAAYTALEVLAWWKYLKDTHEQAAQERSYKELARQVGRANFSTVLPDADWTYYETMRDWQESGVYNKNIQGPVDPETDTTTYNGHQWDLALRTNPTVAAALAQYERVAIKPEFRWSWRNAGLRWDIFKQTTSKRNDANYAAGKDLIVIGANHLISMVDAFAAIRLQVQTEPDGRTSLGAQLRWR